MHTLAGFVNTVRMQVLILHLHSENNANRPLGPAGKKMWSFNKRFAPSVLYGHSAAV